MHLHNNLFSKIIFSRNLKIRIFLHILFWFFYFWLIFFLFKIDNGLNVKFNFFYHQFPYFFYDIISTYVVLYIFIEKILYKNKFIVFIIVILLWVSFMFIFERLTDFYKSIYTSKRETVESFKLFHGIFSNLMYVVLAPTIASVFKIGKKIIVEKQKLLELEKQKLESELNLIHAQLNPHFLFNTLNNIDQLIFKDPKRASLAISQTSDLFRYMLYFSKEKLVPIEKEIKYINSLVELYNLRFLNNKFFDFQYTDFCNGILIPPMLFMPFIENAYKHCNKSVDSPGVSIILTCIDNKIQFYCSNKIDENNNSKDKEGGIGLNSIYKRLDILYPNKHILKIEKTKNDFNVFIEINTI